MKRKQKLKSVKTFSTAAREKNTYESAKRTVKEKTESDDIKQHWEIRAERPGVQAVMSARHSLDDNEQATNLLQQEIFEFLGEIINDATIFELGVGIGRMTLELAKRARRVIGCELSETMLARAREKLANTANVELYLGKIFELTRFDAKTFDLVFESIVLLHILNPNELIKTAREMQRLSRRIFITEHTYEGSDFPISRYTILRTPEEYVELFEPYHLTKQKTHFCAGDRFTMMLFEE